MLISIPVRLHEHAMVNGERTHPRNKTIVALISGEHWRYEDFQKTLDSFCYHYAENQHVSRTTLPGKTSSFGVINGINLHKVLCFILRRCLKRLNQEGLILFYYKNIVMRNCVWCQHFMNIWKEQRKWESVINFYCHTEDFQ